MPITDNIKVLKVAKYKCLESLLFQTRYLFMSVHKKKFIVSNHHQIICDTLEKVLSGEITRLIINIAPRYGKTELAVKNFIAHGLSLNPEAKFIHLSYSDTLALDNSEEVKDIVQHEDFQQLFPEIKIKKDSKSKKKWYTTAGGGVYATSAAGQVTGFGAGNVQEEEREEEDLITEIETLNSSINQLLQDTKIGKKLSFGGAIIIDDPIKPEDADSDVVRERVNNRFDSTIRNRVNSRQTPIIIIMQRLHPKDLSGYVQKKEPGVWTVLSLPAIFTNDKGELESLWPHKHTLEELQHLRKLNEIVFDRQYMQNPKPKEGLSFPEEELNYYNPNTVDVEKLVEYKFSFIDPADEGGDDLSAPVAYLINSKIYIVDVIYNQHGTDVNENACVNMISKHKMNRVHIEGNSAWVIFAKQIKNKVQQGNNSQCEVKIVKVMNNKHTRILAQESFIKNNFVFRSDWEQIPEYRRFFENLTSYNRIQEGTTKNKHEDAPDSCAGVAEFFGKHFQHLY